MLLKDNRSGAKAVYKTEFEISFDDKTLRASFVAHNSTLNSVSDKYNSNIYDGDVVEIFVRKKDDERYFEIEVAPNGTLFIGYMRSENGNVLDCAMIDDCFVTAETAAENGGYAVKISVPLEKLGVTDARQLEYNAFRIETDGEKTDKHLFALNPTLSDSFHNAKFFVPLK